MSRVTPALLLLVLLSTACATGSGSSRSLDASDTGARIVLMAEGAAPTVVRPPVRPGPVEVTQAEYEAAMVRFARQLRATLPPLPERRLEVISWGSPGKRDEAAELIQEYLQWCEQRGTPGDCWNVLQGRSHLTDEAKRDLAFALATEGVWQGTASVIDEVLDPAQLQLALMASLTATMALLAIPEPISKLIVISLTLSMVAYVGWDTLSGLIDGWRRMDAEARRARTFAELREVGRRFGRLMGEKVTRLLLLAATAALGSAGGATMGGGGAQLPRLAQATRMAAADPTLQELPRACRSHPEPGARPRGKGCVQRTVHPSLRQGWFLRVRHKVRDTPGRCPYRHRESSCSPQSGQREVCLGHLGETLSCRNARADTRTGNPALEIRYRPARLHLAPPSRRRKDAARSSGAASARHSSYGRDGYLGRGISAVKVSWEPYLWEEPCPVAREQIEAMERQWGINWPEEYKDVLSSSQGMTPHPSVFEVGKGQTSLGVLLTVTEHERWPGYSLTRAHEATRHYVPSGVHPFAQTPGGEFVCFDYRANSDTPGIVLVTVEGDVHPVADSFTEFLARLHE